MFKTIVYLIIIFLIIYIIFFSTHLCENFDNSHEQHLTLQQYDLKKSSLPLNSNQVLSILDPIPEKYLTFRIDVETDDLNNNNYKVIKIFKDVLQRQPNNKELNEFRTKLATGEITVSFLYILLYNSNEYDTIMMLQTNMVDRGLENAVFQEKMFNFISELYKKYVKKDIPKNMLSHLKDVYLHLRFDTYLFISFLSLKNYINFENEVLSTPIINKYVLKEIFDKYVNLDLLIKYANALKEVDLKDGVSNILTETFDMEIINDSEFLVENNDDDVKNTTDKIIDYVSNLHNKPQDTPQTSNLNTSQCSSCRYYNPSFPNKVDPRNINKPPICTSLNQPQLVQPIFINDKMNFQGTDIHSDTSVGSIMPKFVFYEYIEKK